jgi:hypothetical protein
VKCCATGFVRGRPRDFFVEDIGTAIFFLYKKISRATRGLHTPRRPNHKRNGVSHMATIANTTSRFHNLPDAALADELGRVDAISKAAEAELKALKDEFKARGAADVEAKERADRALDDAMDALKQTPPVTMAGLKAAIAYLIEWDEGQMGDDARTSLQALLGSPLF